MKNCGKSKTSSSAKVEGNLFSYGSETYLCCSNLGLSQGPHSSLPFPSSSRTFPRPSAAPPEPPPTTWRSHAICGSSSTELLTASPPCCSFPQAWQTWKNSTPAANPPRETKKCLETLFLKRPRSNRKVQFHSTYFGNKDRWSPQGSGSFSKRGTNTGYGEMYISLLLNEWREPSNPSSLISLFYPTRVTGSEDWNESSDPLLAGCCLLLPLTLEPYT